jgi:hypothetical protein
MYTQLIKNYHYKNIQCKKSLYYFIDYEKTKKTDESVALSTKSLKQKPQQ